MQLLSIKQNNLAGFQLSPIKQMELAAARLGNAISLAQGIPSFSTPQVIKDFVYEKIQQGLCDKYSLTIGLAELREEIALSLLKENISYNPDTEMIVTAGSIQGITASLIASTQPGDEVLLPSPSYASYIGGITMAGCTPRYVPLDEDNYFDFDVEKMERAINKKTSALLYCTPNNPTGTLFSEEKTRAILDLAEKHNLTVIVDEVYKDFYYNNDPHFSPALVPEARDRLIRVCSFSKAYAMTGWRVGFLLSTPERVQQILKFHDAMVTCAPVVSQYAAIAALRYGDEFLKGFIDEFRKRRDCAITALDGLSEYLDYQIPKATYFVFPRVKDTVPLARDSERLAYDILEKAHVALVPGIGFGPSGESHLRINFGREIDELEEGLARLGDYFSKQRAPRPITKAQKASPAKTKGAKSAAKILLTWAAKTFLQRNNVTVIGIAGIRGKTLCKRILNELFATLTPTRSNILSYNTEVGLPLSILEMKRPESTLDILFFPLRLLSRALLAKESAKVLILEYGISSAADAEQLCNIASPDWLILTDSTSLDPNISQKDLLAGLAVLAQKPPLGQVLYPKDDALLANTLTLPPEGALERQLVTQENIKTSNHSYEHKGDFVGQSAELSALAAATLAERFGFSQAQIQEYFSRNLK